MMVMGKALLYAVLILFFTRVDLIHVDESTYTP